MTARAVKAGGTGASNGGGLRGSAMHALAEVPLLCIMARERPDCSGIQQKRQNRMLGSWLESSGRPTALPMHQRFLRGSLFYSAAAAQRRKAAAHLNRKSNFRLYSHGIPGGIPSASRRSGSPSKCSRSIAAFGAL